MTPRPWTTTEVKILKTFASLGAPSVALLLERSVGSIEAKAREVAVSLSATGADIDITMTASQIITRLRLVPDLSVCPLCGMRLAIMKNSGMCRVCHLDELIRLRETQIQELARERRLTKLRQDKRRLRVCDVCGDAFFPRASKSSKGDVCSKCEDNL